MKSVGISGQSRTTNEEITVKINAHKTVVDKIDKRGLKWLECPPGVVFFKI